MNTVEKVCSKDLSTAEFEKRYMDAGVPVIITGITTQWEAQRKWVIGSSPAWAYLTERFGLATVPVKKMSCKIDSTTLSYGLDDKTVEIKFSDFIKHWKKRYYNTESDEEVWYLKDWHMTKEFSQKTGYTTPEYFTKDWLNWWYDNGTPKGGDDYRFVYMGEKGTWTPMHHDVMYSFSWSANICGRKKWILFPPSEVRTYLQ